MIEHQGRFTMGILQDLTQLRGRDIDSDLAWHLHLDRLTYLAEAELKWVDRVEERLESAQIPERLGGMGDQYPDQLSGGEQQRVATARGLVGPRSSI